METNVFIVASFFIAIFSTLYGAYSFINKPRKKKEQTHQLKKIIYFTIVGTIMVFLIALYLPVIKNSFNSIKVDSTLTSKNLIYNMQESITNNDNTRPVENLSDSSRFVEEISKYSYLDEEQIRKEISQSLKTENVAKTIKLLCFLLSDEARDEECERIFSYCIKNCKLKKASEVAELFRLPSRREDAKKQLAHEMIKK